MGRDVFYVKDYKADLEELKRRTGDDPFELQYIIDNFLRSDDPPCVSCPPTPL